MHEVAFVDASVVIFLGTADEFDFLRLAASRIVVPEVVAREVAAFGPEDPAAVALRAAPWIETAATIDVSSMVQSWDLGAGEAQVLALASETPNSLAILDDLAARRCARVCGISLRGTLGLVLLARRAGRIPAARPVIDRLRRAGMYLSDAVVDDALRQVGE